MNTTEAAGVDSDGRRICPRCGTSMNHHAQKVDYGVAPQAGDELLGGAVADFHTCPNPRCKYVLERLAE